MIAAGVWSPGVFARFPASAADLHRNGGANRQASLEPTAHRSNTTVLQVSGREPFGNISPGRQATPAPRHRKATSRRPPRWRGAILAPQPFWPASANRPLRPRSGESQHRTSRLPHRPRAAGLAPRAPGPSLWSRTRSPESSGRASLPRSWADAATAKGPQQGGREGVSCRVGKPSFSLSMLPYSVYTRL